MSGSFLTRVATRVAVSGALALLAAVPATARAQQAPPKPNIKSPFPAVPTGHAGVFDHRDSRAVDVLQYMNCVTTLASAGRTGALGAVPPQAVGVCLKMQDTWHGVYGMFDDTREKFRIVSHLQIAPQVRGAGAPSRAAIDTLRAAGLARSMFSVNAATPRTTGGASFVMVPLSFSTYIEVWSVPEQNSATQVIVGGDSLVMIAPDGRREQGRFREAPAVRRLAYPSGSRFVIDSNEDEVPLISELMVARLALERVPEIRIRTKKYESVFSVQNPRWVHTPRRP